MTTFEELYKKILKESSETDQEELQKIRDLDYDPYHLDCLLNPKEGSSDFNIGGCNCDKENVDNCECRCIHEALYNEGESTKTQDELCDECKSCIDTCKGKSLKSSKDIIPVIKALKNKKGPVYALIAPAFQGQFSSTVTPGKLRNAFKKLGFDGMVEVALFADILTLKEALEFDKNIQTESDYQLTSCCCPMWIAMIRKKYKELMPHVPGSVSPMIACGRTVKKLHPNATTVFIGPCVAKKAEAKEPDINDAVDFVLTFKEISDIFDFANINPDNMEDTEKDHSSRAGRIYARSGGVSEAVKDTIERLNPNKKVKIKTEKAQGVKECKEMINRLLNNETSANFFEGMGCVGGCVGGPKRIIDASLGKENVDAYGDEARYKTPIDNPYVVELLHRLGFDSVEKFLYNSDIFERHFD
mgnify:FL=1